MKWLKQSWLNIANKLRPLFTVFKRGWKTATTVFPGRFPVKRPRLRKALKISGFLLLFLLILYILVPLPDPLFPQDYSTVVADEENHILRAFLNEKQQWHFPPRHDVTVPEKLKKAVLHFEDRHFYRHPGVNPVSLVRALFRNIAAGKIKSGASTLSMQVIRLAFNRKRTVGNKLLEMLQALKLELRYSKEQIFKLYVDHAPYGGNIVGYTAASLKYFNRPPDQLTWSQAATLAVLPNAPGLISPLMNRSGLVKKRDRLLRSLQKDGIIDTGTLDSSLREPVPDRAQSFFSNAPHLSRALQSVPAGQSSYIRTTLLKKYQVPIEEMVKNHLEYLRSMGIRNGAALVAETGSGKVRAYIGSQDFFDTAAGGQVDGVRAPRSSGSILKPFLYALAMDDGLVLPSSVIRDVPSYFGAFSPSNADKRYNGLVSAKEALVRSLNVPAVRLLNGYGLYKYYMFLKAAGLSTLFRQPDDYGLTLVLGGAETTLLDLAVLYRGLGNSGRFAPLVFSGSHHPPFLPAPKTPAPLISPGSCWLTLNMLRELKRPGAEFYWEQYRDQYPIAWKTGTSYGQRDAWAVGVSPSWTIAVWVGNFDGEGNPNLAGARSAAPLLFDIFNFLPRNTGKTWFDRPGTHLARVSLCLETGYLAGPYCRQSYAADFPRGRRPVKRCPFHRRVYVTKARKGEETRRVCSLCWEPGEYEAVNVLVYPPDVTQYLRESGVVVSGLPAHKAGCPGGSGEKVLQVLYPAANARLWVPRDFDGRLQRVTLSVAHREPDRKVYWYLDDVYLGETVSKHKMAVRFSAGKHVLEVVDEFGQRSKRSFSAVVKNSRW